MLPLFAPKATLARIDFLRQGERLVDKNGTHNVNIHAEKRTKYEVVSRWVDELTSLQVNDFTS